VTDPVGCVSASRSAARPTTTPTRFRTTVSGSAVEVQGAAADLHEREHVLLRAQQRDAAVQQHPGAQGRRRWR
jgi:hypothetical protein